MRKHKVTGQLNKCVDGGSTGFSFFLPLSQFYYNIKHGTSVRQLYQP